ncbi:MAG: hypothetical protein K0Q43_73 [Ramlibacter sp.]|jgi:hypothetical protein|nr:hypothetical protein [Ramlibacter sp.]
MTTPSTRETANGVGLERMSMAAMPHMPLHSSWLLESPAFQAGDAKVVRAAFLMYERAWKSMPAGTLPGNPRVLGPMLGLSDQELGVNFEILSAGWHLAHGRLVHEGMYELAQRIWKTQADALDHLSSKAVVVSQDPEAFELLPQEAVAASPLKGRKRLPANFGLTPEIAKWLRETLFVDNEDDQKFLMGKFISYARSYNEKYADPVSGFQLFASRENLRSLPSRQRQVANGNGAGGVFERMTRYGNGGESATNRNLGTMDAVMAERRAEAAPGQRSAA